MAESMRTPPDADSTFDGAGEECAQVAAREPEAQAHGADIAGFDRDELVLPDAPPLDDEIPRRLARLLLNVDELSRLIARGGLRSGTMPEEQACEHLQEAERDIAELRRLLTGGD